MRYIFTLTFILSTTFAFAQDNGFAYGLVSMNQLEANSYSRDSAANAIILREFGEAYVRMEEEGGLIVTNLKFEHHYLIKILKTDGLERANITIPLYKDKRRQQLVSVKASAYNISNNRIQETQFSMRDVITENINAYWDMKKITIPNVRVGSIIEVQYTISDPFFVSNFHTWEFQSDIPKLSSEYWASIPGNYRYNITSRGAQKFTKNENEIIRECFTVPGAGNPGDCVRYKFAMENIPAFKVESYMTAKANFLAAVYFELSESSDFQTGVMQKVTKDWKSADTEIRTHSNLGAQLKKGKDLIKPIETELKSITDTLKKAERIYSYINSNFVWNTYMGKYTEEGIKKAFEKKTGNIGDINLSLIAAMRAAGINVELALLSTRENGTPTELHPVITDFNYVVAKVNINNKSYLVDASDRYLPFGMLPIHCLNGKARVFPEKEPSYWYDIKPTEKFKEVTMMNLTLQSNGSLKGTLEYSYYGYPAYDKRTDLASFNNQAEYQADLEKKMNGVSITSFDLKGTDVKEPRVIHKFDVEIDMLEQLGDGFMLNPFFLDKMDSNPFKLSERLYPVDFGTTHEYTIILNLTYPENFILVEKPEKNAVNLPGGGGKFLFDITDNGSKATMTYTLTLNRPAYHSGEYKYIKELFNRVIQVQNFDWLFKKKE